MSLYDLARPMLFSVEAEAVHDFTLDTLARAPGLAGLMSGPMVRAPVKLMGLDFPNRAGLAAGLDKNGRALAAWARMGFGHVEIGTVTPRPQAGNPKPRMFRLPEHKALINRLGFNNLGVDVLVANVRAARAAGTAPKIIGINLGKNADTAIERAVDDYLLGLDKAHAVADYITVNISSPNTPGLRDLQQEHYLGALLDTLEVRRRKLADAEGRRTPMLLKLSPDMSVEGLAAVARLARDKGVDGLIAVNTTLAREAVLGHWHAAEGGGLSGAPLTRRADTVTTDLRDLVGPDYPLIGVGGVMSGADAVRRRRDGASLVQIYTGLIYRGPKLVAEIARVLAHS